MFNHKKFSLILKKSKLTTKELQEEIKKRGIKLSTEIISKYKQGKVASPPYDKLGVIAEICGVSTDDFFNESSTIVQPQKQEAINKSNIVKVKHYPDVYASAGQGEHVYGEEFNYMDFSVDFLSFYHLPTANLETINITGDSMAPLLLNGQIAFTQRLRVNHGLIDGAIYIVNYCGDIYIKRLRIMPTNHIKKYILESDNKKYEDMVIEGEYLNDLKFISRLLMSISIH